MPHEHDNSYPSLLSLEKDLARDIATTTSLLNRYYAQNPGQPLLNEQFDMDLDHASGYIQYLHSMTTLLGGGSSEPHLRSVHAAQHFAMCVAESLAWTVDGMRSIVPNFDDTSVGSDEMYDYFMDKTQAYLYGRPQLTGLLHTFADKIDQTPGKEFRAEVMAMAALTFEAIEQRGTIDKSDDGGMDQAAIEQEFGYLMYDEQSDIERHREGLIASLNNIPVSRRYSKIASSGLLELNERTGHLHEKTIVIGGAVFAFNRETGTYWQGDLGATPATFRGYRLVPTGDMGQRALRMYVSNVTVGDLAMEAYADPVDTLVDFYPERP